MSDSVPSSPSVVSSNFGVLSASDFDSQSASLSDSDFEVVLVTRATAALTVSDSDSGSLISAPTDVIDISDDEDIIDIDSDDDDIIIPNIAQSLQSTPRSSHLAPARFATPRPASVAVARAIVESGHDSDASDREDSSVGSSYDSDSDDGSVVHARARTVTIANDRLEAPIASAATLTLMAHSNASVATIRPVALVRPSSARRSAPAGMHAPAITTNSIMGIMSSAPLSPPTPSDGGEIPYAPFTAAPAAVFIPVPVSTPTPRPTTAKAPASPAKKPSPAKKATPPVVAPAIPTGEVNKRVWSNMNVARMKLGFEPLQHALRKKQNADLKAQKKKAQLGSEPKPKTPAKPNASAAAKPKAGGNKVKSLVAPRPTVGASPITSEDEAPRMRASMFSPVNDMSVRSDSPDEAAYDEAIKQLDE
jgi:hypothetical protein